MDFYPARRALPFGEAAEVSVRPVPPTRKEKGGGEEGNMLEGV